jgi:hypothetical protein
MVGFIEYETYDATGLAALIAGDQVSAAEVLEAAIGRAERWQPRVWGLTTHPADPNRIAAFSLFGEVYVSQDAGASWRKIAREFGEIRAAVGCQTDFFQNFLARMPG